VGQDGGLCVPQKGSVMEKQLLKLLLNFDFYRTHAHLIQRDIFPSDIASLYDTLSHCHDKYGKDLSEGELLAMHLERHPATTKPNRLTLSTLLDDVYNEDMPNPDLAADIMQSAWTRAKAAEVADMALDMYTGGDAGLEDLLALVTKAAGSVPKTTPESYTEVTSDLDELLDDEDRQQHEFGFDLQAIQDILPGMGRGRLCIVFARPEVGKSTFVSYLAGCYLTQGHKVAYFGNEEPATRVKLRVIQSYFGDTREELVNNVALRTEQFNASVGSHLKVYDCVGMDVAELDRHCELYSPDVIILDQADKMRVSGNFNRTDERLKEIYVQAREVAKRRNCLVIAVSQAGADAEGRTHPNYDCLDNSKTGKAGEADVILGLGKDIGVDTFVRGIYISKNKISGLAGRLNVLIDPFRAIYKD